MRVWVGCSGWYYRRWKGIFYPEDLPIHRWFAYYQEHFDIVELNSPFYRFPKRATVRNWLRDIRSEFRFAVKVHRSISHYRHYDRWPAFYEALEPLGDRLRVILVQLPPSARADMDLWHALLAPLSGDFCHAIEFRHVSWFDIADRLCATAPPHVLLVSVSAPRSTGIPERLLVTHGRVYLRMHGRTAWYRHDYTDEELMGWIEQIRAARPEEVYVFFNNDVGGNAPRNALRMRALLSATS